MPKRVKIKVTSLVFVQGKKNARNTDRSLSIATHANITTALYSQPLFYALDAFLQKGSVNQKYSRKRKKKTISAYKP